MKKMILMLLMAVSGLQSMQQQQPARLTKKRPPVPVQFLIENNLVDPEKLSTIINIPELQAHFANEANAYLKANRQQALYLERNLLNYLIIAAGLERRGVIDLDLVNEFGQSILFKAVLFGQKEIVELLLELGAKVNMQEVGGRTALEQAAFLLLTAEDNDQVVKATELIKMLIAGRANPNIRNKQGYTPLMTLALRGKPDIENAVLALLRGGADPRLRNKEGKTVIDYLQGEQGMDRIINTLQNIITIWAEREAAAKVRKVN